jgi:hypothetical protein
MKTKLAGVTFNNAEEDGGRSRQQILEELVKAGRQIFTADLIYTSYKDEFAIKVREHATKQIVGWIPRDDLYMFADKKIKQMTGFINYYGVYCVRLEEQQAPTHEQYAYMKDLCGQNNWGMPAYDRRAYANIFNMVHLVKL